MFEQLASYGYNTVRMFLDTCKDPANGLIFFQRLSGMLGERLLESYARYEKLFRGQTFV